MLLAVETKEQQGYVNDDTVEGACVLMGKIGYLIDEKLKKIEAAQESSEIKQKKNEKNASKFYKIFNRFQELSEDGSQCSLRVRMIIKNLLDNRDSGWEKTKKQNEGGPKKVEDLRKELERKARDEEQARINAENEELSYLDQQNQYYGGKGGK